MQASLSFLTRQLSLPLISSEYREFLKKNLADSKAVPERARSPFDRGDWGIIEF